ncbi:MAG: iron-sulfur cluster assembly protein [Alphaproteobacteria bacterium]|jgi:iron-sulfur cluster assembly protein
MTNNIETNKPRPNKPRPSAIRVTDIALQHLVTMMEKAPDGTIGIKLGLKNAGCAGMSYVMDYTQQADVSAEIVDLGVVKIFIDAKSLLFLLGMEMDYEITKLKAGFVFNNPNQTDACGCGESIKLVPADPSSTF